MKDIIGDCGTVGVVGMMVTAVARVAALIRINLFYYVFGGGICGICSICDGIFCVASSSGIDGNSDYDGPLFPTTTTTSGFGRVLMSVVVMVGYCW